MPGSKELSGNAVRSRVGNATALLSAAMAVHLPDGSTIGSVLTTNPESFAYLAAGGKKDGWKSIGRTTLKAIAALGDLEAALAKESILPGAVLAGGEVPLPSPLEGALPLNNPAPLAPEVDHLPLAAIKPMVPRTPRAAPPKAEASSPGGGALPVRRPTLARELWDYWTDNKVIKALLATYGNLFTLGTRIIPQGAIIIALLAGLMYVSTCVSRPAEVGKYLAQTIKATPLMVMDKVYEFWAGFAEELMPFSFTNDDGATDASQASAPSGGEVFDHRAPSRPRQKAANSYLIVAMLAGWAVGNRRP